MLLRPFSPKFPELLDAYEVKPPFAFEIEPASIDYVKQSIENVKPPAKGATKEQKATYETVVAQAMNHILGLPAEMTDKYMDYTCWTLTSTSIDLTKAVDKLNKFKDEIIFELLKANPSWRDAAEDSELGKLKAYYTLLAEDHPDKNKDDFKTYTLADLEFGKKEAASES